MGIQQRQTRGGIAIRAEKFLHGAPSRVQLGDRDARCGEVRAQRAGRDSAQACSLVTWHFSTIVGGGQGKTAALTLTTSIPRSTNRCSLCHCPGGARVGKFGIIHLCDQEEHGSPVQWCTRACPSAPQLRSLRTCALMLCIFAILASAISPVDDAFQPEYGYPSHARVMAVKAKYNGAPRSPRLLTNAITGATQPALARSELSVPRDLWGNAPVEVSFGSNGIRPPPGTSRRG